MAGSSKTKTGRKSQSKKKSKKAVASSDNQGKKQISVKQRNHDAVVALIINVYDEDTLHEAAKLHGLKKTITKKTKNWKILCANTLLKSGDSSTYRDLTKEDSYGGGDLLAWGYLFDMIEREMGLQCTSCVRFAGNALQEFVLGMKTRALSCSVTRFAEHELVYRLVSVGDDGSMDFKPLDGEEPDSDSSSASDSDDDSEEIVEKEKVRLAALEVDKFAKKKGKKTESKSARMARLQLQASQQLKNSGSSKQSSTLRKKRSRFSPVKGGSDESEGSETENLDEDGLVFPKT